MANKSGKSDGTGKRGRSARNGQFVTQQTVKRNPNTTVNETTKSKKKSK